MDILFVLYHDFRSNSALHVYHYANALVKAGCRVTVAVPFGKDSYKEIEVKPLFQIATFDELLSKNDHVYDIIHAWTPREIVRSFCYKLQSICPKAKLIVHLEDNEESILKATLGIENLFEIDSSYSIPQHLSHPIYYKEFLERSHGATILMDTLAEFIPPGKSPQMIWPIIDEEKFCRTPNSPEIRRKYGIKKDDFVISYIGNVHPANYREVRSLYLAVILANKHGIPAKLLRTGEDHYDFYEDKKQWDRSAFIELGYVSYEEIPIILNEADLLIQPGEPNSFNDYRLPSKIPEFLMTAKPVVLPNTNLAKFMKENEESVFLRLGNSLEILEKIKYLYANKDLRKTIGRNGLAFAKLNFNEERNCISLLNYYKKIIKTV